MKEKNQPVQQWLGIVFATAILHDMVFTSAAVFVFAFGSIVPYAMVFSLCCGIAHCAAAFCVDSIACVMLLHCALHCALCHSTFHCVMALHFEHR